MSNPHDALFRQVFAEPTEMVGLLRSALPGALARAIDWDSLAAVPGSFVDEALHEHHSDLLFQVHIGERPSLLYVLCEHKSQPDGDTAFQLLRYVVRVWEAWRRKHPGGQLPPVVPFVLHHGDRRWSGPVRMQQRVDFRGIPTAAVRVLRRLLPDLGFVLDDLAAQGEGALESRAMSAIATISVLLLQHARGRPPEEVEAAIARWQRIVAVALDRHGQERLLILFSYLFQTTEVLPERVVAVLDRPLGDRLEETLMSTAERLRQEGRAEILLRQLARRFGPLSPQVEHRVRTASIPELDQWAEAVLTARSLEEVLTSDES